MPPPSKSCLCRRNPRGFRSLSSKDGPLPLREKGCFWKVVCPFPQLMLMSSFGHHPRASQEAPSLVHLLAGINGEGLGVYNIRVRYTPE